MSSSAVPSPGTSSSTRPSPTVVEAPGASGLEVAGALAAIALALAAALLGYRVIRGGRGL
jgi:hypothetical protein